ncbi:hypothetical protein L1887_14900 [Cichorium endivia]|nr:hypothetical protein L1887_14900 [Cichorium endivia]
MESLVDSHLALVHEETSSISQSHMELVVGSCASDHRWPPTPPVLDLHEVELFVLHQNFWWDRLQVGITGAYRQWTTIITIIQHGHIHLVAVVPHPHDNTTVDATGVFSLLHFDLHLVKAVVGTKSHLSILLMPLLRVIKAVTADWKTNWTFPSFSPEKLMVPHDG